MEDEEQDNGPTIEDILSAISKTKSKFGVVNVPFPAKRRFHRRSERPSNAADRNVPHQSDTVSHESEETLDRNLDKNMTRSVSTPEVRKKSQMEQHGQERYLELGLKCKEEDCFTGEGCVVKQCSPRHSRHGNVNDTDTNADLLCGPYKSTVKTSEKFPSSVLQGSCPVIDALQTEGNYSINSTLKDREGRVPARELQSCTATETNACEKWNTGHLSDEGTTGTSQKISPAFQHSTYPSGSASFTSTKKLSFRNSRDSYAFQTSASQSGSGTSASRCLTFCSKANAYSSDHQRNINSSNISASGRRVIPSTAQSFHKGSRTSSTPFKQLDTIGNISTPTSQSIISERTGVTQSQSLASCKVRLGAPENRTGTSSFNTPVSMKKVNPSIESRIGTIQSRNQASVHKICPNQSESKTGDTFESLAPVKKMNPIVLDDSGSYPSQKLVSKNGNSITLSKSNCSESRTGIAVAKSLTSVDKSSAAPCKSTSSLSRTETASSQNLSSGLNSDYATPKLNPKFQTPSHTRSKWNGDSWSNTSQSGTKFGEADFIVNGNGYIKLSTLGTGGSSVVYEVLDIESKKVGALKVVDLRNADEATLEGYKNEIAILERLDWSDRVITLYEYEQTPAQLKIVLEKGNGDLASFLNSRHGKEKSTLLSPFTIQHYWHAMLQAVQAIHKEGIIHSDLKPANFLLVGTTVKLIDFGIASSIQQDMTSVFKDSQAGTYNYMSPESLRDIHSGPIINGKAGNKPVIKIGVKSDVWSLGCILYNMVYGRTPFQHIGNPIMKLAAISNPTTQISFPIIENKLLLDTLKKCLQFDPKARPSIEELLEHPYLNQDVQQKDEAASPKSKEELSSVIQQLQSLTPNSLSKVTLVSLQSSLDLFYS